jgi:hypothetical protein
MISFFNRATQRIYEAFNGPKVVDTEFDEKLLEMQKSEQGMMALRQLFLNCDKNFSGLRFHFTTVHTCIKSLYDGNSAYDSLKSELVNIHLEGENILQNFAKQLNDVKTMTDEWIGLFSEAKLAVEKRVIDRREYEHYDKKMEEMMIEKSKKQNESPSDIEKYNRVSLKIIKFFRMR